ncbi:MAG: hypothetical protein MI923_24010 [Phycisphaerales bacterium]|nr:hypothetical protein [Phycisphaerales bacterium]
MLHSHQDGCTEPGARKRTPPDALKTVRKPSSQHTIPRTGQRPHNKRGRLPGRYLDGWHLLEMLQLTVCLSRQGTSTFQSLRTSLNFHWRFKARLSI